MHTKLLSDEVVRSARMSADYALSTGTRPARLFGSLGETEFVRAGTSIYMQDDTASYLYQLINGTISTFLVLENGNRRVTGFLSDGDYFGSIFSDHYQASAEAKTDCTVVRYSRQRWSTRDLAQSSFGPIILDALENELKIAEEHVLLLGGVTACAKVAAFLLYLSKQAARRGEPANPISIPMTRYDIADFLGTTPESVSRCLTKLKQSGAIKMSAHDTITLVDRGILSDIPRGY